MQPTDITDTIITGILPTPTRVLGQKQTVASHFHVSGHLTEVSHFQGMTSPIIDFPQIRVELPEYRVTLHLYVWPCVQVCMRVCTGMYDSVYRYVWQLCTGMYDCLWQCVQVCMTVYRYVWQCVQVCMTVCTGMGKHLQTLPSHQALSEPQGFSQEKTAGNNTNQFHGYIKTVVIVKISLFLLAQDAWHNCRE